MNQVSDSDKQEARTPSLRQSQHSRKDAMANKTVEKNIRVASKGAHVVTKVWIHVSDRFGARRATYVRPVGTIVGVSLAGPAVAAEGYRVGEGGTGRSGTSGQVGRTVLHPVVAAACLDQEARAKCVPDVAVLLTVHKQHSVRAQNKAAA